ncbi:Starch synthase I [Zea mays]|uniref:Starch synthase I n=1 Tax=Zea mays TaxID=4577 RepID=A0A1D6NUV0_MAIZE|nr:Starch synthase I [Zea mays]
MATPSAVGAACLLLARAAWPAAVGDRARPRRLQRVLRRRCVAELSREGPAPRPLPPALLAPPLVPGFLAPPAEPTGEPASTPPPVPDAGLGVLGLEPEGIAEGSIDNTVVVASEQDSEIVFHPNLDFVCFSLLAAKYRPYGVYKDSRSILVIHNLAHQGVEPASTYPDLGLPPEWYGALEWVFPEWARRHALDKGEAVNFLKGAVVTADRIVTVSKGYSWEVTTAEGGQGLNELLSSRKSVLNGIHIHFSLSYSSTTSRKQLSRVIKVNSKYASTAGIVNGIDINDWNPATDKCIPCHYSVDDLSGKAKCKGALQKELGLPIRPDVPLIGFIGRLDYQKGIDLIQLIIPDLMREDVQFENS